VYGTTSPPGGKGNPVNPIETDPKEAGSVSNGQRRQLGKKLLLLLFTLPFCVAVFLALDWFHSRPIERSLASSDRCIVRDLLRIYALKPNCSCIRAWGDATYPFTTNSFGFRDEKIREVPLTDPRPRILMLGDSFTEAMVPWTDSYVGRIAANFPQYEVLNGSMKGTSPSNYLSTARIVLREGLEFDEVIVFIDISDAQDEAGKFQDIDASGAVGLLRHYPHRTWYSALRLAISKHFLITNAIFEFWERNLVRFGCYHLDRGNNGNEFDFEESAWTYRRVSDTLPSDLGYAPLGLEGGIAKEKAKMTLLWQELKQRNIPISVVVYPWPAQLVHDTVDSRQVQIWRDWCAGRCKRFISVFPAFFARKQQCPRLEPGCWYLKYFVFGDIHYNAEGNAVVAEVVSKSLSEMPPAKLRPQVSSAVPQQRTKDGVRDVPVGGLLVVSGRLTRLHGPG